VKLFLHQLRCEQLVFWRSREAAVFVFLFPILFYLLLGSLYDGTYDGHSTSTVLLVGLLGYGAANTAFAGVALHLVFMRETALLKRLRATPLPAPTFLGAYLVSTLIVFALQSAVLIALAHYLYDAELPASWPKVVAALAFGAFCFGCLGIAAAALIRTLEGSSAVVNLILLPMGFLSGSFVPRGEYPGWLQEIGRALPLGQHLDLVSAAFYGDGIPAGRGAILTAWGVAGAVLATRRFRWEPTEG
jgi:ABC-2 type transport system permease protein